MIIGFEVVAGLIVFAYALYIVFFLLFKVIQGSLKVLKECRKQRVKITDEEYDVTPEAQLDLTMADGGDQVEEEEVPVDERGPRSFLTIRLRRDVHGQKDIS